MLCKMCEIKIYRSEDLIETPNGAILISGVMSDLGPDIDSEQKKLDSHFLKNSEVQAGVPRRETLLASKKFLAKK